MGLVGFFGTGRAAAQRGLKALTVDPFAPNFCALRRVSSNFERM
jgi:hypothetical protein